MKIPDYTKASVSLTTKTTQYRAWADGPGYSKGDLLCRTVQLNADTLVPTGVETWTNGDLQTVLAAAPAIADVKVLDEKDRVLLGSQTIAVGAAAASANPFTIPAGANLAEISVIESAPGVGGDILMDVNPVDNSATPQVGHPIACGSKFELESAEEIANFAVQALDAAGDDAALHVTYFCQFGQGNV